MGTLYLSCFVSCSRFLYISPNHGIIKAQASASHHCACPICTLRSARNSSNSHSSHLLSREASWYTSRILLLMDIFAEIHKDTDGSARTRHRARTEPEAISVHVEQLEERRKVYQESGSGVNHWWLERNRRAYGT